MKKIISIITLFISISSFAQFNNNNPTIFNILNYGAVGDNSTNNDAAYVRCVTAIYANGGGVMYFPQGAFIGKVILPAVSGAGLVPIEIRGVSQPGAVFGTVGTFSFLNTTGTILKSSSTTGSIIQASSASGGFSNIYVYVRDLEVRSYDNPQINGIDLQWALQIKVSNVFISTGTYTTQINQPTYNVTGLLTPNIGNAGITILENVAISGYYKGLVVNEHTDATGLCVYGCYYAMYFLAADHASIFVRTELGRNRNNIYIAGLHYFNITQLDIEHPDSASQTNPTNVWQVTQSDVRDTANLGRAFISSLVVHGNSAVKDTIIKNGGAWVDVIQLGTDKSILSTNRVTYNNILNLSSISTFAGIDFIFPGGSTAAGAGVVRYGQVNFVGTNDVFSQLLPLTTTGYGDLEAFNSAGLTLGTGNDANNTTAPIIFRPNRTEKMRLASTGNFTIGSTTTTSMFNVGSSAQFQVNSSGAVVAATGITQTGNITLSTAGNKINIATGSNASVGVATLSGGTVTVSTTAVTASSIIFLTDATTGVLTNIGTPTVGTKVAGTSFIINSSNVLDTSNVNWIIIN